MKTGISWLLFGIMVDFKACTICKVMAKKLYDILQFQVSIVVLFMMTICIFPVEEC